MESIFGYVRQHGRKVSKANASASAKDRNLRRSESYKCFLKSTDVFGKVVLASRMQALFQFKLEASALRLNLG